MHFLSSMEFGFKVFEFSFGYNYMLIFSVSGEALLLIGNAHFQAMVANDWKKCTEIFDYFANNS